MPPKSSANDHPPSAPGAVSRPTTPAVRQRLQAVFEHAQRSAEKADHDYANDLLTQCVVEDPGNLIFAQHLLGNLSKKYGGNKKGARFSGLRIKGARSSFAKAAGKGLWREAFQAGCDALKQNPWDVGTLIALADASETLGHEECALYYLRWALDADPNDPAVNRRAAQTLAALGQFDQAIACWLRVQQAKPGDFEAEKAISQLSVEKTIKQGGYNQGLLQEDGAAAADPRLSVAAAAARHDATETTTIPTEMHTTQHARDADDPHPDANQPADVESQLRAAIDREPAEVSHYVQLAEFYLSHDRIPDGERALGQALSVSGGDLAIREQLEDIQLRRIRQQVEIAERRARQEGTQPAVSLARRMASQANQAELEIYAARSAREPANTILQYEFGLRLKRAGKFREAIQALQASRSDSRRRAQVEIQLGDCFQRIRQHKLAMTSYEAALEACDSSNLEHRKLALYLAGVLAADLNDIDRAEKHLGELAALDFGYRDVADRLDKLAALRDSG